MNNFKIPFAYYARFKASLNYSNFMHTCACYFSTEAV